MRRVNPIILQFTFFGMVIPDGGQLTAHVANQLFAKIVLVMLILLLKEARP
jgi:hypothetical protein